MNEAIVSAPFFLRGEMLEGSDVIQRSRDLGVIFTTPAIPFGKLVPPRTEVPPLLNVPLSEIIDFLCMAGDRIRDPKNEFMRECIDRMASTHILPREVVANQAIYAAAYLDKRRLMAEVEQNFPDPRALDEWIPKQDLPAAKALFVPLLRA
jgi:hypothetical protein